MSKPTIIDEFNYTLLNPGKEKNPILCIDDFLPNCDQLIEQSKTSPKFSKATKDFYPGLRKPAPPDYRHVLTPRLKPLLTSIFDMSEDLSPEIVFCAYSLTTTQPQALLPIQRVPHFDTANPNQLACVHYLCDQRFGGTAFYRHKQTQYEAITPNRFKHYTSTLENEATTTGLPPPEYINGNSKLFQQIEKVDAKFNRTVIYRSNLLHSGSIQAEAGLSRDPSLGRLTINTFIKFN